MFWAKSDKCIFGIKKNRKTNYYLSWNKATTEVISAVAAVNVFQTMVNFQGPVDLPLPDPIPLLNWYFTVFPPKPYQNAEKQQPNPCQIVLKRLQLLYEAQMVQGILANVLEEKWFGVNCSYTLVSLVLYITQMCFWKSIIDTKKNLISFISHQITKNPRPDQKANTFEKCVFSDNSWVWLRSPGVRWE